MTGSKYKEALMKLGLTHEQAARSLDIAVRTSIRYAKAEKVPATVALALEGLAARRALQQRQLSGNVR